MGESPDVADVVAVSDPDGYASVAVANCYDADWLDGRWAPVVYESCVPVDVPDSPG